MHLLAILASLAFPMILTTPLDDPMRTAPQWSPAEREAGSTAEGTSARIGIETPPSAELAERRRGHRLRRLEREYRRHVARWVAADKPRRIDALASWLRDRGAALDLDPAELLPAILERMASDDRVDRWCRAGLVEFGSPPPPDLGRLSDVLASLPAHPRNPAAGPLVERWRRSGGATIRVDGDRHRRIARRLRRIEEAGVEIDPALRAVEATRDSIRAALGRMDPEVAASAVAVFDVFEIEARLRGGWPLREAKRILRTSLEQAARGSPRWHGEIVQAIARLPIDATAAIVSIEESSQGRIHLEISRIAVSREDVEAWIALLPSNGRR